MPVLSLAVTVTVVDWPAFKVVEFGERDTVTEPADAVKPPLVVMLVEDET